MKSFKGLTSWMLLTVHRPERHWSQWARLWSSRPPWNQIQRAGSSGRTGVWCWWPAQYMSDSSCENRRQNPFPVICCRRQELNHEEDFKLTSTDLYWHLKKYIKKASCPGCNMSNTSWLNDVTDILFILQVSGLRLHLILKHTQWGSQFCLFGFFIFQVLL